MKLKLTLDVRGVRTDVVIVADASATVGDVADRLRRSHPDQPIPPGPARYTLSVAPASPQERTLSAGIELGESGIRSGDLVSLVTTGPSGGAADTAVATLNVVSGPGAPRSFPLRAGTNFLGRDRHSDVMLSDPLVSKRHAKITISDAVHITDDGSANGILISGQVVDRVILKPGGLATVGDTTFTIVQHVTSQGSSPGATAVQFNRSPRLDPTYEGVDFTAPQPPKPPQTPRFPMVTLVAPIIMGALIFTITQNVASIAFVALSPIMMMGGYFENRANGKRTFRQARTQFRSSLLDLSIQLQYAADLERRGRRREHPSASEIAGAIGDLSSLTWTRRPEHDSFLKFRLGLGTRPSRNSVEMPSANDTLPELWRELTNVVNNFSTVARVPVVADLRDAGNVGVSGADATASGLVGNVVGQMVGLHAPSELVMCSFASESASERDWFKWLPHVGSEFSPLECEHLAGNSSEANVLASALEGLVEMRSGTADERTPVPLPVVLVVVHDDAPVERARLVQIAERGPAVGVFTIWIARTTAMLPAACRTFIEADTPSGSPRVGFVRSGEGVADLEPESIDAVSAARLSRRLAPVVDSGSRTDDLSDLPRAVSFLSLAGLDLADDPHAVVDLWRENHSLPPEVDAPPLKRSNTLRALAGQSAGGPMHLDLRAQGPHALVGGTTGSGKSEFLQSWVLGMAAMHSPARVTFLFVDYKGGAAFAECVKLPHCVGLVTDLSPHLVRRALTSLNAELRHREHILNEKKAKDLIELERRNDPDTPPSLVIVVDEFAALVSEVPEFVDGVVNVAQRGRSLGLHLILATQRPAGVIKDNLRANTNLRIALRMADESDSTDVIGTPTAATFDPSLPGRGVAKTGPGRLAPFQSAYVGGRTSNEPPEPGIDVRELRFGVGAAWEQPETTEAVADDDGPNDIKRIVDNVIAANAAAAIPAPRKPWLADLAPVYRLDQLPTRRTDEELVFGVVDDPEGQRQPEVAFSPDRDGNMAVYGTGGSGKSTFLRTVASAAAFSTARGGPVHVYGLDFGSRGLQMLEGLPHVGSIISGDDSERVHRLLRQLKELVDDRADRYAKAKASTIVEYRERAGSPDEPRVIVLIDGVGAFRTAYETGTMNRHWELFQSLAADGRGVGLHFVVSADRPASVSSSLSSAIQQRLVLRMADEMDYMMVGAPSDGFTETSPPGRGFLNGSEVQVAVVGGDSNVARQSVEIERLTESMLRSGVEPAHPIDRLGDLIPLSTLPVDVDGLPVFGVWDHTLTPIGFEPTGTFVVSGPPASGKTTTVASMIRSLRAARPQMKTVYLGQKRSPLAAVTDWDIVAIGVTEISEVIDDLTERLRADTDAWVIVIESIAEFLNTAVDLPLQEAIKAAKTNDDFVIAEGETSTMGASWPLLASVKSMRTGFASQPDQTDGDLLFKTPFPRTTRRDFPQGRGFLTRGGHALRVQAALPE